MLFRPYSHIINAAISPRSRRRILQLLFVLSSLFNAPYAAAAPPTIVGGEGHYMVAENAAVNTSIGYVAAIDTDGDALSFSLETASSNFAIDPNTGELSLIATLNRNTAVRHEIIVSVSDATDTTQAKQTIFVVPTDDAATFGVTLERWLDIRGSSVSTLTSSNRYPDSPSSTEVLSRLETIDQPFGNYGQRLSTYLRVPETDNYRLWIASDDQSELYLSSDASADNPGAAIATVDAYTNLRQWNKYSSQQSAPVTLVAGRVYKLQVLHKEGGGADHVSVAMRRDGDATSLDDLILTGDQLLPNHVLDTATPSTPGDFKTDLVTNTRVDLGWEASTDNIGVLEYRLSRDGEEIAVLADTVTSFVDTNVVANSEHQYSLIAYDAFGHASAPANLLVNLGIPYNSVELALSSGDARVVSNPLKLVEAALAEIALEESAALPIKAALFNLNADGSIKDDGSSLNSIYWNPTHDAALFTTTDTRNYSVLQTNDVTNPDYSIQQRDIGIAGENDARYIVLGSNPTRPLAKDNPMEASISQFMRNALAWLRRAPETPTAPFNVVIAHLDDSHYFRDDPGMKLWLDREYGSNVTYNDQDACNGAALAACLTASPDLLIISQANAGENIATITAAVESAIQAGIPVLYLHWNGNLTDLGAQLLNLFEVSYYGDNYWRKLQLSAYDPSANLSGASESIGHIKTMLNHFNDQNYAFDWSACTGSSNDNCSAVSGLSSEFQQGANAVRTIMNNLDVAKKNLFQDSEYRLQKLLALIGDRFRQDVSFPMDKVATSDDKFLRSYYADHAVYNYRLLNPAQADMGNFSRSDFSHITPGSRTIAINSKRWFKASGAYALPGQTVSVTRHESSDLSVKIFVNSVRRGSTHQYQSYGYKRPKYLQTPRFSIEPGETIQFTSVYGGPIQIEFSDNDLPVELEFNNIGEHAFWESSADDTSFAQKLAANEYDWAELVTPGFQVHSKLDRMVDSVNDAKWGSPQALAAATARYMHNFPHVLAGFKGPGIDVVPEISEFAAAKGWSIDNLDKVKHMNADQASCGSGCSGNPYDAYWAFDPIGHGDVHELGHGLQGSKRFVGWVNHSMTNHYSYYTKSKYNETTGGYPSCQSLPFEQVFNALQASVGETDRVASMATALWDASGWNQQAAMFIQMLMSAQANGAVENGWHIRARLHVMEREFNRADDSEASWLAKRDVLGFSNYTRNEAQAADNNDWLLIAISVVTGLDYRDYLAMWGIPTSAKAQQQVADLGYTSAPSEFYMSAANGYCLPMQNGDYLGKVAVPVDGSGVWPTEIDDDQDGYWDALDNCPSVSNPSQENRDGDAYGDLCDLDNDNDSVEDILDNCEFEHNPDQADLDEDGIGDACDDDIDGDMILNEWDNCPLVDNPGQEFEIGNDFGEACDPRLNQELCFPIKAKNGNLAIICL